MSGIRKKLIRSLRGWRRRAAELTPAELERWLAAGQAVQLVDIRGATDFQESHLPRARHLSLDRLEQELAALDRDLATVVY